MALSDLLLQPIFSFISLSFYDLITVKTSTSHSYMWQYGLSMYIAD